MEKIKNKIQSMTLQKGLIFIVITFVIVVFILSAITIVTTVGLQRRVLEKRKLSLKVTQQVEQSGTGSLQFDLDEQLYEWSEFTIKQSILYYGSIVAMILLPITYVILGIILSAAFYYRLKLKVPIYILSRGIENITNGDLDFELNYFSNDELGELCNAMEAMRLELRGDKKRISELIEEKNALNASVSHDLGTPITVIKGYIDYLKKGIPDDLITEDILMDTLNYMGESTDRLERYINCVRDIHRLEDIEINIQKIEFKEFYEEICSNMSFIKEKTNISVHLYEECGNISINCDKQIIFRIIENIVKNALRYARSRIMIELLNNEGILHITITDDGNGFADDLLKLSANRLFITDDKENHCGIGLFISKLLCKKHGGNLFISNKNGGACVTVQISIN